MERNCQIGGHKVGTRAKMSREMRAKQFMPFAALKGYSEALRRKEKVTVPRPEFSEEYQEELDRTLRQVQKNDMVSVVYFSRGEFRKVTGMVSRIDPTAKLIRGRGYEDPDGGYL